MRKKILCAFLMIMSCGLANANIHIDGKKAREIVLKHIDIEHQVSALKEYNVQLKATGNYTMSAAGLYKVCTAAGWDIKTTTGKAKCNKFVQALVNKSDYKYYEVCGKDKGKSGGTEYCIDNVFDSFLHGTQVTMLQADGLCKEYARVKYNDDIECSEKSRPGTINPANDYVKCTSKLKPRYYEFKFDDVKESTDGTILRGVIKGIGKIHDVDVSDPGCTIDNIMRDTSCALGYKTLDISVCEKLNKSLNRFGYRAKIGTVSRKSLTSEKLCAISDLGLVGSELKTAYGIPYDVFYKGNNSQTMGSKDLIQDIKTYVANKIKPTKLTDFYCENGTKSISSIKGGRDTDDVLTCYANGNQMDFVFDDLAEWNPSNRKSADAARKCVISEGTWAGETCYGLSQQQCNEVAARLKAVNPRSKGTQMQGEDCILLDIAEKKELDKQKKIGAMFITATDCATSAAGNVQGVMGCKLFLVQSAGIIADAMINEEMESRAHEFLTAAVKCNDHTCAVDIIKNKIAKVLSIEGALRDESIVLAVDKYLAKMIDLLEPEDLQSECRDNCSYQDLITALGGDPDDPSGLALRIGKKVAFFAQYASLLTSAFRLTGQAFAGLAGKAKTMANIEGKLLKGNSDFKTLKDIDKYVTNTRKIYNFSKNLLTDSEWQTFGRYISKQASNVRLETVGDVVLIMAAPVTGGMTLLTK